MGDEIRAEGTGRMPVAARDGRVQIPTTWVLMAETVMLDPASTEQARVLAADVLAAADAGLPPAPVAAEG